MGSATVRRFALVAVMVVLVTLSGRPSVVDRAVGTTDAALVRIVSGTPPAAPAIRRHVAPGGWILGSRVDHGRTLLALAVLAMLSLLRPLPWSTLDPLRSAPSSLTRRRHVIALRAPPVPTCA